MDSVKKLNSRELKDLAHFILSSEFKENNLDYKDYAVTYVTLLCNPELDLKKKISGVMAMKNTAGALFLRENLIIIYLNRFLKMSYEDQVYKMATTCFHEVRHAIQKEFDENSYDDFINKIQFYNTKSMKDYAMFHESYSFEIGADLYAIGKSIDFLKKYYPDVYKKKKDELDKFLEETKYRYLKFLPSSGIDQAIRKMARNKQFNRVPVLKHFVDFDTNEFKSIKEIRTSKDLDKVDKRIVSYILTTPKFRESINEEELSEEDKKFLEEASYYAKTSYKNYDNQFGVELIDPEYIEEKVEEESKIR